MRLLQAVRFILELFGPRQMALRHATEADDLVLQHMAKSWWTITIMIFMNLYYNTTSFILVCSFVGWGAGGVIYTTYVFPLDTSCIIMHYLDPRLPYSILLRSCNCCSQGWYSRLIHHAQHMHVFEWFWMCLANPTWFSSFVAVAMQKKRPKNKGPSPQGVPRLARSSWRLAASK